MAQKRITSMGEQETVVLAGDFAQDLASGDVVALYGDLGAGKSVFCRAVVRFLCADEGMDVPSPTYTLVQDYAYPGGVVRHFDLYRLGSAEEVYETGWEEAMEGGGIVLVEWPERLGSLLPARRIDVTLSPVPGQPDSRTIEIFKHDGIHGSTET